MVALIQTRRANGQSMDFPRYIVVEGPIGVGKTTLVSRLTRALDGRKVLETFEDNPFLPLFYQDPERYAFQTEVFFMLSRYKQQQDLGQQDLFTKALIGDYIFGKTRLFAGLTLTDEEFRLYDKMFQALETQVPQPDLVIYLTAPLETLLSRINRRGRPMEASMDPDYLGRVCEGYQTFFAKYTTTPLLVVDSTAFNFADDGDALAHLLDAIKEMASPVAHLKGPGHLDPFQGWGDAPLLFSQV